MKGAASHRSKTRLGAKQVILLNNRMTFLTTLGNVIFFSNDNFNVRSPNGSSWIMCSLVMKSRRWSSCEAETYILGTPRVSTSAPPPCMWACCLATLYLYRVRPGIRPLSVRRRLISLVYSRGFDAEDFDAVSPGGISAFPGSISSRVAIKTCLALRTW